MARRLDETGIYWQYVDRASREIIETTMRATPSISEAARILGVSKAFLIEKLQKFGAMPPRQPRVKKTRRRGWRQGDETSLLEGGRRAHGKDS